MLVLTIIVTALRGFRSPVIVIRLPIALLFASWSTERSDAPRHVVVFIVWA
jgi:hypothetical protein